MADGPMTDAAKGNDAVVPADSCAACFYGRTGFAQGLGNTKHVECRRYPDPRDKNAVYWCGEFKARVV